MKKLLSLAATALVAMSANAAISDSDFANNDYIGEWGRLKVQGTHIVSEKGEQIQIKGWSSFGWQNNWGDCHSEGAIQQMKLWGANIYRGAMYVEEDGYNSNPSGFTQTTKNLIDLTAKYKMYYLCDWHVLTPGGPLDQRYSKFRDYFKEISQYVKEKGYHHVLYEICNEPNNKDGADGSWGTIKNYANQVIPIIRANDPKAIVVVGTPQWDQRIDEAQNSPLSGYDNIMYSFHYYACSHKGLLSYYTNAVNVIPVFISEWGVANFDGGQQQGRNIDDNCKDGARALMNEAFANKTPWCCWSFGEKPEQASALMGCGSMELSPSGQFVVQNFMGGCLDCKIKQSDCYLNECQHIPGVLDLGLYDQNPDGVAEKEGGLTVVGAGEGVAYHEENTVADEQNDGSLCNGAYKWGGEGFNFRPDECVDASNCYGLTNTEGWHNLGYIEPLEWEQFTVEIEEPGYYSIEALVNPTTNQELSITSRTYGENLLVDLDASTPTEPALLPSISFSTNLKDQGGDNWKFWEWETAVNNLDDLEDINAGILFKEAGKQTIRVSWGAGGSKKETAAKGDFGPLNIKFKSAYTGEGYSELQSVKAAKADDVTIYPNPTSDVVYATGDVAKIEICNIAGCIVAKSASNSINIANLANGTYIAKVTLGNGAVATKTIIKK